MKIRNKILVLVLVICLFSVLSLSLTFFLMERRLTGYSREVNTLLISSATDSAEYALISQAHDFLQIIAREQADSFNEMLESIMFTVRLIAGVTQDIFNNQHDFPYSRPVLRAAEIRPGAWGNSYTLADHIPMTEQIQHELNLLSNMNLLMPLLTHDNPHILWLYVGMESGLFYNYTNIPLENPLFDPRERPWYTAAVADPDNVIFTEVYEDAFGAGLMMTAAKAVFDADGELLGVAAIDILLEHLSELISDIRITDSGSVFILNSYGQYIIHSDMARYGFEGFQAGAARHPPELAAGYDKMMRGEVGIYEGEVAGDRVFLTFSPIPVADWSVGFIIYEDELLSPLNQFVLQAGMYAAQANARTESVSGNARFTFTVTIGAILLMVILLAVWLTKIISKPIIYEKASLERLNRLRTKYLADISHETRTPLTAISVNIQLAADLFDAPGAAGSEDGNIISKALRQAQEDVLRVARMSGSALWLATIQDNHNDKQMLDMVTFLQKSAETYRNFIEKRNNTYIVSVPSSLPQVLASADQLVQVIMNLLTNASSHTAGGIISLEAGLIAGPNSDFIKITVKDTGTGVKPELLEHIFERGVTGTDGSGLGLSISRDIVESHGGTISIESQWGEGTTVTILLPEYKGAKEIVNA